MYAIVFHAHQKLDRVAHRHLRALTDGAKQFPTTREILKFEGKYGPDATKLKNKPGVEQPWHFINPLDESDDQLLEIIQGHHENLVLALRDANNTRASFEAAWLAHALVDGLTPAHHYPYEEELESLRGSDRHSRNGIIGRAIVKGESPHDSLKKSYKLMGPKGLLMTHTMFEAGAYSVILPMKLASARPTHAQLAEVEASGIVPYFKEQAKAVAGFGMYDQFYETGWTPQLARLIRRELAPRMVRTITIAWCLAYREAGLAEWTV